jgi:hypothetical protein
VVTKFLALTDERTVAPGPMVKVFDFNVPAHCLYTPYCVILDRAMGQPMSMVQGAAFCTPAGQTYAVSMDRFSMGSNQIRRAQAISAWGEGDRFTFYLQTSESIKVRTYIPILVDTQVYRDDYPTMLP